MWSNGGVSSRISWSFGFTRCSSTRRHGAPRPAGVGRARHDAPRLRDRVDGAGIAAGGPERRAVVEVGATVPAAVPRFALDRRLRASPRVPAHASARAASPRAAAIGAHVRQHARAGTSASHTLSPLPSTPTRFMPSFQSPVPISGRPCAPTREAPVDAPAHSARTACRVSAAIARLEVRLRLSGGERRPVEERNRSRRGPPGPPSRRDSASSTYGSQSRSSEIRVRTPRPAGSCHQCCTSPSTNCRDAAFRICARVRSGRDDGERHDVLQLVAEAVGAAGLVERGPRPHAAGERLVEQPLIQHQVERAIGRLAPGWRPARGPTRPSPPSSRASRSSDAVSLNQRARLLARFGLAEQADDRDAGPPAGISQRRSAARSRDRAPLRCAPTVARARPSAAGRSGATPLRPRNSVAVAGPRGLRAAQVGEGDRGCRSPGSTNSARTSRRWPRPFR